MLPGPHATAEARTPQPCHDTCGWPHHFSISSESSVDFRPDRCDTEGMDQGASPSPRALVEAQDRFIAVWGQMAGAWGISRTMAEVHALLYITGQALCTDDIMERLE